MKNIEILRKNNIHDEYLKKLLNSANLEAQFISREDGRVSNHLPLILVIEEDYLDQIFEICDDRDLKIIVALNSRKEFKLISKFKEYFKKIFGFLDLSQDLDYNTPLLLNYIYMNFSSHAIQLDKLANDLSKILDFTKNELNRVKDLHDKLIKIRVDEFKNVSASSKFMAGEKSGGEFFDLIQEEDTFLYLQAGSNSYIISSLILSEFETLKQSLAKSRLMIEIQKFEERINQHAKGNNAEVSYCIILVDLKKFKLDLFTKGNGAIYWKDSLIEYTKFMSFNIIPGEKIIMVSAGALRNLAALNNQLNLQKFFGDHSNKSNRDLIYEFFFELTKNKTGTFLIHDALMSVIEFDSKKLYSLNS